MTADEWMAIAVTTYSDSEVEAVRRTAVRAVQERKLSSNQAIWLIKSALDESREKQ